MAVYNAFVPFVCVYFLPSFRLSAYKIGLTHLSTHAVIQSSPTIYNTHLHIYTNVSGWTQISVFLISCFHHCDLYSCFDLLVQFFCNSFQEDGFRSFYTM